MEKRITLMVIAAFALSAYTCGSEKHNVTGASEANGGVSVADQSDTIKTTAESQQNESIAAEGINFFQGSWDEALATAKKEDKLIFLDAYASWCGPCKRMAANVFPDGTLGAFFNENFINYKMDMEKGVGPELATKFGLRSYPTLYFIDSDGNPVKTVIGYHETRALLSVGQDVVNHK